MKFDIEFKFTRMQKDRQCDIQCQPLETLLKVCDGKAKESLEKSYLNKREQILNLQDQLRQKSKEGW